ncbi:hypothetical protein [Domibacillus indicus]|uniref:hypothetical protein n=1 Tax=Domibacillus indicus TaxID=1437523 RepID=UPI000617B66A|nr:hypothetical protein [Domibacillus indicus]
MLYLYEIKNLYNDLCNFEISPHESIENFHIRSEMNEVYHLLTEQEKTELDKCDYKIIENAEALLHHLQTVYDFDNTKRPIEEWWWHLHKISCSELTVALEIKKMNS